MRHFAATISLALLACTSPRTPESPPTNSSTPTGNPDSTTHEGETAEARRLAESLDPNTKQADRDVTTIAESSDPVAIDHATQKLTRYYAWLNSREWQTEETSKIDASNRAAGLDVKPRQLQGQFEHWRAKHQRHARRLLFRLGEYRVADDALADASNEELTHAARILALDFLEQDAPGLAHDKLAWAAALRKELSTPIPGSVDNAAQVVAGLREPFRDCYKTSLGHEPSGIFHYSVTIQVDSNGAVSSVSTTLKDDSSREDPLLTNCVKGVARSAQFTAPNGGSAVINLPLTFVPTE